MESYFLKEILSGVSGERKTVILSGSFGKFALIVGYISTTKKITSSLAITRASFYVKTTRMYQFLETGKFYKLAKLTKSTRFVSSFLMVTERFVSAESYKTISHDL